MVVAAHAGRGVGRGGLKSIPWDAYRGIHTVGFIPWGSYRGIGARLLREVYEQRLNEVLHEGGEFGAGLRRLRCSFPQRACLGPSVVAVTLPLRQNKNYCKNNKKRENKKRKTRKAKIGKKSVYGTALVQE